MKIRTRLLIYNIIIIVASGLLALSIVWYSNAVSKKFVKKTFGTETCYTMHDTSDLPKLPRPEQDGGNPIRREMFYISVLILIAIVIVALLAVLLSNILLKRVMKPIKMLEAGANRIQNANYNEKIVYNCNDEFSAVIDNFNSMQATLAEKTKRDEQHQKAKTILVNGISHDIRTPLTAIRGKIKGVMDGVANNKKKRTDYLAAAYERTEDIEFLLDRLVQDFNDENLKLNLEKVNLYKFVRDTISKNVNVEQGLVRISYVTTQKDVYCKIDKLQMQRVLDNLINNTVKHNGQKNDLEVDISVDGDAKRAIIHYMDNGKGVKDENINKIFDDFFKEDGSRNLDKRSPGLGLAIVRRIIDEHGGTIEANNKQGLGFVITLPRVK